MNDKHIRFQKDKHTVTMYLNSDIDKIGATNYQVRIYGDNVSNQFLPFTCQNFSQAICPADRENKEKINTISEENYQVAEKNYQEKVKYYVENGFVQIPTLTQQITNTIDRLRSKFFKISENNTINKLKN